MRKSEYAKALKIAQDDLEKLFREREELERKIARMRDTVISLGLMVEHKPGYMSRYAPANLTEACLHAILASRKPLDPNEIRRSVERIGFDIGSSNPLASVYSVLKRLLERDEIRKVYPLNSDGSYMRLPSFWWARDNVPDGWVAPTQEQFDASLAETGKQIGKAVREEFETLTKKLAKRADALERKKKEERSK